MCLAIPAKITELDEGNMATVDILGVTRSISIDLTPQATVGDYVLVHAGFAIEVVSEQAGNARISGIARHARRATCGFGDVGDIGECASSACGLFYLVGYAASIAEQKPIHGQVDAFHA